MNKIPLITRLAILQQGEYEWRQYLEWRSTHTDYTDEIQPKQLTLKLQILKAFARIFSALIGIDAALHLGIQLLSFPQAFITWMIISVARIKLRYLQQRGLYVVAVCGSYAKTSTKHILHHVLATSFPTHMTPGNINRSIGIAREILFQLNPTHKVFIVEMGEYDRGDIQQMTQFVHPSAVIITPITIAHLERFSNADEIETEIFDAARYSKAHVFVHERNEESLAHQKIKEAELYSPSFLDNVHVSRAGTEFQVKGIDGEFFIPLFGRHNAENTLPAILLGQKMGMTVEQIKTALSSLPFVPHRLEPTLLENNILLLDNGYNANPQSSKETLAVLKQLEGSVKIVCTPGFVELGSKQEEENEKLGERIAKVADVCLIMKGVNTDSLRKGLRRGGMKEDDIYEAANEIEGMNLISSRFAPSSIVLFENSIPQLYQR